MTAPHSFHPGQLVHHKLFGYRGVVVSRDATCQAADDWYDFQTSGSADPPPKDRPWYHVLVDGKTHTTYVAERNLEPDRSQAPIAHPLLNQVFQTFLHGRYYKDNLN